MPSAVSVPTDPDCLFCRIVSGDLPATVVREDEHTVAFRDLEPQAPTHVLVIPRRHVPNLAALAEQAPLEVAAVVQAVAAVAREEGVDQGGYRTVFNTGADAHQTVFHAHVHVLGGRTMTWPPG
ncbi:MAG TPA: histidine triad nucleotide-binding protein [Pedococcus sp.]|jgi:histidine triad (HIT) family protein|nr:histidine triad nucleotide-binding protein [Pedococcus sp.]